MHIPSGDPLIGVFPPSWSVGDRWKVIMTIPDDQQVHTETPKRTWVDIEYQFEVESAPEGPEGDFRVAVDSQRQHYVATYSKQPFAFVRLEDRGGRSLTLGGPTPAPPSPPFFGVVAGFITDFPVQPESTGPGKQPVKIGSLKGGVEVAPTRDGARWTYTTLLSVETFTWSRGQPWWSTLEKRAPPELEAHTPDPVDFRARLVSSERKAPKP